MERRPKQSSSSSVAAVAAAASSASASASGACSDAIVNAVPSTDGSDAPTVGGGGGGGGGSAASNSGSGGAPGTSQQGGTSRSASAAAAAAPAADESTPGASNSNSAATTNSNSTASTASTRQSALVAKVRVGSYLDVYWPLDDARYPAKVVGQRPAAASSAASASVSSGANAAAADPSSGSGAGGNRSRSTDGNSPQPSSASGIFTVIYTDSTVETLNLHTEKFQLLEDDGKFVAERDAVVAAAASAAAAVGAATIGRPSAAHGAAATISSSHPIIPPASSVVPAANVGSSATPPSFGKAGAGAHHRSSSTSVSSSAPVAASSSSFSSSKSQHLEAKLQGSRYDSTIPLYTATSSALSDDVYLTILSYLPTLATLGAFGTTCRRIYGLWGEGTYREIMLERLFARKFGTWGCSFGGGVLTPPPTTSVSTTSAAASGGSNNSGGGTKHWQQVWEDMNQLRVALTAEGKPAFVSDGFNRRTKEQMCQLIKAFTGGGNDGGSANDDDGGGDDGKKDGDDLSKEKAEPQEKAAASAASSSSSAGTGSNKRKRGSTEQRRIMRRTMGVLTEREEDEAIYYDNPSYAPDSEGRYCFGYFGMVALNAACHGSNLRTGGAEVGQGEGGGGGPPVAVWGDFPGVRIFDCPDHVLYDDNDDDDDQDYGRSTNRRRRPHHARHTGFAGATSTKKRKCTALAHVDGEGLVLFALVSPFTSQQQSKVAGGDACPCLFLAMSSGMVISIGSLTSPDGITRYSILSSAEAHDSEVTSLALVRNPARPDDEDGPDAYMVASCSVDGHVHMYQNAFDPKKKFSLVAEVHPLSCTYSFNTGSPLYSIASTVITSNKTDPALPIECKGNKAVLVATGNEDGSISIWGKEMNKDNCAAFELMRKYKTTPKSQASAAGTIIIVSRMCFINNGQTLVTGSNHGDVRVWNVRLGDLDGYTSTLSVRLGGDVCLHVRHRMPAAHVGAIDSIEHYGDLVFTSGGLDGLVRGWDLNSGRLLGVLSIHPGRLPAQSNDNPSSSGPLTKKIMSSVVGTVLLKSGSLISLCRDGTLHNWNFKAVAAKYQTQKAGVDDSSNVVEKDWLSSFVSPAIAKGSIGGKKKQRPRPPAELKRVMTKSGRASQALQQKMRLAIFKASVAVALQPERKDMPFLGADGKLYESTKKAFSRYSGLVACAACRAVAQGAFYCRLVRAHELSPSSLAEVRNLLKVNGGGGVESKSSKRAAQDMTSSLSMLESITEDDTKSTESKKADSGEEEDEWQCHQCSTLNDDDDVKCTTCWASKKKVHTKPTTARRK